MQTFFLILAAAAGAAILFSSLFAIANRGHDKAAGVQLGQVSPEEDSFQHQPEGHSPLLTRAVCERCGRVRCADGQWRGVREVRQPEEHGYTVQTSHSLCPPCLDAKLREAEAELAKQPFIHPPLALAA